MYEILRAFSVSTFTFIRYKIWTTKGLNPQPASQVLVQLTSVEARGPIIRYILELNTYFLRYIIILTHRYSYNQKRRNFTKNQKVCLCGVGET